MSTHHRIGLAKYLEVLGQTQLPVDLGDLFWGLSFLICKMGGVDWLWSKQNLRDRNLSPGS